MSYFRLSDMLSLALWMLSSLLFKNGRGGILWNSSGRCNTYPLKGTISVGKIHKIPEKKIRDKLIDK